MVVLPVPIPFQTFVEGLAGPPFLQLLAYPQPAYRGMQTALLLIKAADPPGSGIVVPVPSERPVHLIDELQSQILEFVVPRLLVKAQKVTDREGVGPEVAPLAHRLSGDSPVRRANSVIISPAKDVDVPRACDIVSPLLHR